MVPLRSQGFCGVGRGHSGHHWVWYNARGPHLVLRKEPQGSSPFQTPISGFLQSWDRRVRPRILLRRCGGQGAHAAKTMEPRGFSRVAAAFSSYEGDLSLPLGLALGSPIFPLGCEGKLGVALESLQGRRDLT